MKAIVTVKAIAGDDGPRWAVLATLDSACLHLDRCHFTIITASECDALRVASDLLAAAAQPCGAWVCCNVANDENPDATTIHQYR